MKHKRHVIAGTALGLLMASAPLGAYPLQGGGLDASHQRRSAVILAQADCQEGDPSCEDQQGSKRQRRERRQPAKEQVQPEQQAEPQDQAEPEQQQRRQRKERPAQSEEQPAAAPEQDQQQSQRDRKRAARNEQQAPAAEPQAAPKQQPEEQQQRRKRKERPVQSEEQPAASPEAAPRQEAAPEEQQPRRERRQRQTEKQAPAAEPQAPAQKAAPVEEAQPQRKPRGERKSQPDQAAQPDSAPAQKAPNAPAPKQQPAKAGKAPVDPNAGPNAAPIFDSQKEAPRQRPRKSGQQGEQAAQPAPAPVDRRPPPQSDKAATEAAQPKRVEPVRKEEGRRVERRPDDNNFRRRERPEGLDVVREIGDRVIIRFGDRVSVESNDRPRMSRGAQDVYYEDLPRGRIRETILRKNGNQIVTIRNRYGDVIRRSRITPDGREYVLSYVDESNYDRVREWRDPGFDLPPMRLAIPVEEYILDAGTVDDPDDYYDFLEQPPVERVQRLYSVDEVKRSARVRDIARRVDLDTLTFEFGSAEVPENQIEKLEGVANAMEKLLAKNPAETFLIEGHTDAVGSDEANLALSDRRAEAVAEALTNVFAIPPENLATQGYGERYLKVNTAGPEQENRRVGIRRITPLVAPVASAN